MSTIIPRICRLSPLVTRVLGCNPSPMTLQGTNTYIVGNGSKRVLIDAGQGDIPEYRQLLEQFMTNEKCSLDKLILTHWHQDHIGGVKDVLSTIRSPVAVHKFPRSDGPDSAELKDAKELTDGETVEVEGARLTVVHTPGHTTDHVILYLREENAVFSGDCILGEGTAVFESLYHYMQSLHKILDIRPSVIYPGHGPAVADPIDKIKFYIEHRNKREEQILSCIRQSSSPVNLADIVTRVYTETPDNLLRAAQINVGHHMEKLLQEKKVKREGDEWVSS